MEVTHVTSAHITLARASHTAYLGCKRRWAWPELDSCLPATAVRHGRSISFGGQLSASVTNTALSVLDKGSKGARVAQDRYLMEPGRQTSQERLPRRSSAEVTHEGRICRAKEKGYYQQRDNHVQRSEEKRELMVQSS